MQKFRLLESISNLPTPISIRVWWNAGSILGVLLIVQLLSGILLSIHYAPDARSAFDRVIHIIRDVEGGWLLRSIHANGASMFFLIIYLHIGRGLYYQRYITQTSTWIVGVTIFLLSMATAFLGYVLPWGQISFWGATVITNLFSAIPYFGASLVEWIWGGFSVNGSTLNRFYSLHFLLPFIVSALAIVHLIFLHEKGSTNPLGEKSGLNKVPFHPYFTWKDIVGFVIIFILTSALVFFYPNLLTDPENFTEANPIVTPTHIQPEWYFLFAYAILRSIPSKLGGVVALVLSVTVLYFLPLAKLLPSIPGSFNPIQQVLFWTLVTTFFLLTWLGRCPIEDPYLMLSTPVTIIYFAAFPLMVVRNWLIWRVVNWE